MRERGMGAASVLVNNPDDEGVDDRPVSCAICGGVPAFWLHRTRMGSREAIATGWLWHLCDDCHDLAVTGQLEKLADRMTMLDLSRPQRLELARRIT